MALAHVEHHRPALELEREAGEQSRPPRREPDRLDAGRRVQRRFAPIVEDMLAASVGAHQPELRDRPRSAATVRDPRLPPYRVAAPPVARQAHDATVGEPDRVDVARTGLIAVAVVARECNRFAVRREAGAATDVVANEHAPGARPHVDDHESACAREREPVARRRPRSPVSGSDTDRRTAHVAEVVGRRRCGAS